MFRALHSDFYAMLVGLIFSFFCLVKCKLLIPMLAAVKNITVVCTTFAIHCNTLHLLLFLLNFISHDIFARSLWAEVFFFTKVWYAVVRLCATNLNHHLHF